MESLKGQQVQALQKSPTLWLVIFLLEMSKDSFNRTLGGKQFNDGNAWLLFIFIFICLLFSVSRTRAGKTKKCDLSEIDLEKKYPPTPPLSQHFSVIEM